MHINIRYQYNKNEWVLLWVYKSKVSKQNEIMLYYVVLKLCEDIVDNVKDRSDTSNYSKDVHRQQE